MSMGNYPKLVAPNASDPRGMDEMFLEGYCHATVQLENGKFYNLYFSDPVQLQQDLESELIRGGPCFDEPGLVVVPEVTLDQIEKSIRYLYERRFFDHLLPSYTPAAHYGSSSPAKDERE